MGSLENHDMWRNLLKQLTNFKLLIRTPDLSLAVDFSMWITESMITSYANGLDPGILDQFLRVVRDNNLYRIIEGILSLRTSTIHLFSAQLLLSCIEIEDNHLLNILLARKVPLDGFRHHEKSSALQIAVEKQNEKFVQRLLNAAIDPNGYVEEEELHSAGEPLYRLIPDCTAGKSKRISNVVLKAVLESRWRVYKNSDCIEDLEMLILRKWDDGAIECLAFLRNYYQTLNRAQSSETLLNKTHQNDDQFVVSMLINVIQRGGLNGFDYFWHNLFIRAFHRRRGSVLRILIENWYCINGEIQCHILDMLDYDRANFLLTLQIDLPSSLYLASKLAVELEDDRLCAVILDEAVFTQDVMRKLDSDPGVNPHLIISRATRKTTESLSLTEHQMKVAQLISSMEFYGVAIWPNILDHLIADGVSETICEKVVDMCESVCPKSRLKEILERSIKYAVQESTCPFSPFIEVFRRQNWKIDWSTIYKSGDHYTKFDGDNKTIQMLTPTGLPYSKALLIACINGYQPGNTVPFLLEANPNLVHELTLADLSHCFNFRPTTTYHSGESWDGTYDNKGTDVFEILINHGMALKLEWREYMASKSPDYSKIWIIRSGYPCTGCVSMRKCLRPIYTAIGIGNITLLKGMITEGFNAGQPQHTASCTSNTVPLIRAIEGGKTALVEELIQAGADVNAYGKCKYVGDGWARLNYSVTALQVASYYGNFGIVCKLLSARADINARASTSFGLTALSTACAQGRLDIVHLLIEKNPHRRKLKHECRRAARHARLYRQNPIAKMLENVAASLTTELGRDEVDDGIDRMCKCQIKLGFDRYLMCSTCQHLLSTGSRTWRQCVASTLLFGNTLLSPESGFKLKRALNGDETLKEVEDLLEYQDEEEHVGSEYRSTSHTGGEERNGIDESSMHEIDEGSIYGIDKDSVHESAENEVPESMDYAFDWEKYYEDEVDHGNHEVSEDSLGDSMMNSNSREVWWLRILSCNALPTISVVNRTGSPSF